MYLFINEVTIQPYNDEILKLYSGSNLIRIISNPTDNDLRMFGYKPLTRQEDLPEYDIETQYLKTTYELTENAIIEHITVENIEIELKEEEKEENTEIEEEI